VWLGVIRFGCPAFSSNRLSKWPSYECFFLSPSFCLQTVLPNGSAFPQNRYVDNLKTHTPPPPLSTPHTGPSLPLTMASLLWTIPPGQCFFITPSYEPETTSLIRRHGVIFSIIGGYFLLLLHFIRQIYPSMEARILGNSGGFLDPLFPFVFFLIFPDVPLASLYDIRADSPPCVPLLEDAALARPSRPLFFLFPFPLQLVGCRWRA